MYFSKSFMSVARGSPPNVKKEKIKKKFLEDTQKKLNA